MSNTVKTLEEQLADEKAKNVELQKQLDVEPSAAAPGSTAPVTAPQVSADSSAETPAPAVALQTSQDKGDAPVAPTLPQEPQAAAAPAPALASVPAIVSIEDRVGKVEGSMARIEESLGRLGTQLATNGAETEPIVTTPGENGSSDNSAKELSGIEATEAAFEKEAAGLNINMG